MKTKQFIKYTSVGLTLLIISSCALLVPATPEPEEQEVKINYDFVPPETTNEKVDITFLLLNPKFVEGFKDEGEAMYSDFAKNMAIDFEEMLVAKGYAIRGPYDSYDEIVFSDKTETDLMLEVEIDLKYEWSNGAVKRKAGYQGVYVKSPDKYYIDGDLFLGGKLNLVLKEALTQEKLWVKSVPLEDKTLKIKTKEYKSHSESEGVKFLINDVHYKNAMYVALDDYYQKALNTAWKQLDPNELIALKKQVKVLRAKKGY